MTSVRRSDPSPISAQPDEPEASAAPAARPALKPSAAPAANQLEPHPRPASSARPPDPELINASTDLVKGYVHPGIFEKSRPDLAQKELSQLPPREFSAVLARLERSGSLERFLGQLSPEQKSAFLETATGKGALQREAGHPSAGPLNPPAMPSTYAVPAQAPLGLARAAVESNSQSATSFYQARQAYLDRYEAAARSCSSGAELRAMGPHLTARSIDHGVSPSHPQYNQLHGEWVGAHRMPSDVRLQQTVSNKLSDFMGEARAGSFFVEGEIGVEVGKVSLSAGGRIYDYGKNEGKAGGKAKLPNGLVVGLDSKGATTLGAHVGDASLTLKGGQVALAAKHGSASFELAGNASTGKITRLKAELSGNGVTIDHGRGQAGVSLTKAAGAYGFYDPNKGEFGGGVKGKLESGSVGISYQAAMGMQGLSKANALQALNGVGVFGNPPELSEGKAWNELGARGQDKYRRLGWNEQEWTTRLNARG